MVNHKKQVSIFANGEIAADTSFTLPPDAFIIAADGGARHCLKLGLNPHVVIGDFDSLTNAEIETLSSSNAELLRYPTAKDETDLELALDHALKLGASKIALYGLLGGRWDMTFANLLLLAAPQYAKIQFRIFDGSTTAYILRGGETLELNDQQGATVSAIPLSGSAHGITYQGLRWSLEDATLPFGTPRGVSNQVTEPEAQISLEQGILLIFVINSDHS